MLGSMQSLDSNPKLNRKRFSVIRAAYKALIELAEWGRNYKGDFIAGFIAFLIAFLISCIINELSNVTTILSFFGLLFTLAPLFLGSKNCYECLCRRFMVSNFKYPIKIGILNGSLTETSKEKRSPPAFTEFEPSEWFDAFSKDQKFEIELIPVTKISDKYRVTINPFGEMYPEENVPNLLTLKKIVKYLQAGGLFVNVAGLAFYYSWDGEKDILTGPPYETYALNKVPGILYRIAIPRASYLTDTWLYRQFGVRTTFFDPTLLEVHPISDSGFEGLDKVGGDTKVNEFRSAFRSEGSNMLFPILITAYKIKKNEGETLMDCYPVAVVKYGLGYLALIGMKLEKVRKQDFEKAVEAIKRISNKLHIFGTF